MHVDKKSDVDVAFPNRTPPFRCGPYTSLRPECCQPPRLCYTSWYIHVEQEEDVYGVMGVTSTGRPKIAFDFFLLFVYHRKVGAPKEEPDGEIFKHICIHINITSVHACSRQREIERQENMNT